ncbi:porin [Prevotella sp. MA2016]|uniref:porin n=1 Tax=Prevotella sp. MA2016 TaxID=1408310 RepID=UPI00048B89C1|nr:porin [Prevotella sp. MA2016]
MKKLTWLFAMLIASVGTANAETLTEVEATEAAQEKATIEVPAWVKNIKFSGYGMLQYQGEDTEGAHTNTFNLRLARFILDGKIGDFDWRAQIQGTNATGPGQPTVQLVDLYAEWRKYPEFKIRAGQFKRAFTFENPTNPITQGWYSYAMVVNNLSAFGDRTGEKSSGGRDVGIQFSGDLFPNANGRRLFHYQIGVYNGEGINAKDVDNRKDIIGGVWVMPIKGVRIGAFGWTGSRGGMLDKTTGQTISIEKNRYALSAEYDKDEYTFRAEYIHSQGWGAAKAGNNIREIDYSKGDKADGWYAFGIVPVVKGKLHAKARYQTYRSQKEWTTSKSMYEVGLNYYFTKNLQLNAEYGLVNERSAHKNHNFVDVELDFRF